MLRVLARFFTIGFAVILLAMTAHTASGDETGSTAGSGARMMESHIIGIGGVFLRAKDKNALTDWYSESLDISINEYGGHDFFWRFADGSNTDARTVLSFFDADSKYFEGPVMVNYIVRDLDALLEKLQALGIPEVKARETYSYGRFAWIKDPEGRWIELWEPVYASPENTPPQE